MKLDQMMNHFKKIIFLAKLLQVYYIIAYFMNNFSFKVMKLFLYVIKLFLLCKCIKIKKLLSIGKQAYSYIRIIKT